MSYSNCSRTHRNPSSSYRHYLSPLERLDRRTAGWKPKKVKENDEYRELCRKGACTIFQPCPSTYRCFFINRETSDDTLDDLIEYAEVTTDYTIDTEGQSRPPPQHPDPSLLQIECVHRNFPSLMILIETLHLPPQSSTSFKKIRNLCQVIFSHNNIISSWGEVEKELEKFYRFNLFDHNNITHIKQNDIQGDFKIEFHKKYPTSPYVKIKQNETYSLQMAIFVVFKQWLDKRMTLADWGCGIDLALGTYKSSYGRGRREDEEEIRRFMTIYAMNDCFAVTQLAYEIQTWELLTPPTTIEQEEERRSTAENKHEPIIELHPPHEEWSEFSESIDPPTTTQSSYRRVARSDESDRVENPIEIEQSIQPSERRMVHVSNEPNEDRHSGQSIEPNAFDYVVDKNNEHQRRTSTDLHFDRQQRRDSSVVHDLNEPSEVSRTSRFDLEVNPTSTHHRTAQQIRNRIANDRRRPKCYRFEVTRQVYPLFNISKVKSILKAMDIRYVNINIVRHTLFIGLKNKQVVEETEKLIHDRIFTEQHYLRLYPKNEKQNSSTTV